MLPRLIAGPGIFPIGAPVFWPTTVNNSGLIGAFNPFGISTYALTFNSAGSFDYFCILHQPNGMAGTITVG